LAVPILKQGSVLIASIQTALTDTDVLQLREDVMGQVTRHRSRGAMTTSPLNFRHRVIVMRFAPASV
jgi:hypothetical protein